MAQFFVTGASGYIGSAVTRALIARGDRITALSRTSDSDARLRDLGATPVRGTVGDVQLLRASAEAADGVLYIAQWSPDEMAALSALTEALAGSDAPLLFTSGASMVAEETGGHFSPHTFAENAPFTSPRGSAIRVQSENIVREAPGIRGFAIRPGLVFGHGYSGQVELYSGLARRTGNVRIVGPGENLWAIVHLDDLVGLYLAAIERGTRGGLYHALAGEVQMGDVGRAVATAFDCPAGHWTLEEAEAGFGKFPARVMLGSSCRPTAELTNAELKFRPSRTDLLDEITSGSLKAAWFSQPPE